MARTLQRYLNVFSLVRKNTISRRCSFEGTNTSGFTYQNSQEGPVPKLLAPCPLPPHLLLVVRTYNTSPLAMGSYVAFHTFARKVSLSRLTIGRASKTLNVFLADKFQGIGF